MSEPDPDERNGESNGGRIASAFALLGLTFLLPSGLCVAWFGFPVAMYLLTSRPYRMPIVIPLTQELLAVTGICLVIGIGLIGVAARMRGRD